jgi:hypothetical protein
MGAMDQPVADRVGDTGVTNGGMPRGGRELTGDQGRGPFTAIFDDFKQVAALGIGEGGQQPIVDRQQIELGEFRQVCFANIQIA